MISKTTSDPHFPVDGLQSVQVQGVPNHPILLLKPLALTFLLELFILV
jgi:hypothetical protein